MSVQTDTPALEWLERNPAVIAPSEPGGRGGFLTDVLVELGFCEQRDVDDAVRVGREAGKQPTSLLIERGQLTGYELARATAERNGLAFVDLPQFELEESAQLLIERSAAHRYRAVPIAFAPDGTLVVALADPLDSLAVSDIAMITKSKLLPVVADPDEIETLIEAMPETPPASLAIFEELSDPNALTERSLGPNSAAELERLEREVERERDTLAQVAAQLVEAERRAGAAERRADVLAQRANALDQRAEEAERRAEEAERRAGLGGDA